MSMKGKIDSNLVENIAKNLVFIDGVSFLKFTSKLYESITALVRFAKIEVEAGAIATIY